MRDIELEIEIAADAAAVWEALSTAEGIMSWFAPIARVEPGAGGTTYIKWGEGMEGSQRIEIWEPDRHLRIVGDRPAPAPPSVVDYFIEGRGGNTVMRLVQSGFGESASFDDEYNSTRAAWAVFLQMMKHSVERGVAACRNVSVFRILSDPPDAAWEKLMTIAAAEMKEGTQPHFNPQGHCCCLEFPERQGAMLSIFCEKCSGQSMLTLTWLLYDVSAEEAESVRARWAAMLDQTFEAAASA